MRQRVSMARTLAAEPKIMLMDEPFAALDEQTRLLLGDKVLQIQQQLKQTTLLITHNITEAVQLSDRILVMTYRPGKLKRMVKIDLPRPRTSEIVSSEAFGRYVAQIWSDLREEASRGLRDDEAAKLQRSGSHERAARSRRRRWFPLGCSGSARSSPHPARRARSSGVGLINRFIVPMPSEILAAFPRVIIEEHVLLALPAHGARRRSRRASWSRSSASPAACCSTSSACCGRRPRPGWRRSRPRRSC